ncbi:MAG: SGNH/GDSL hydrolase family protein [Bacilli bacterium]|nr:SGNH/GDSL hydrolase family protein [Bacilli bacterium]
MNRTPEYAFSSDEEILAGLSAQDRRFDIQNVPTIPNHPLKGKLFYWLGSSVTEGSGAEGQSMADYLAAKSGCLYKKDAVSGTTLFDDEKNSDSYIERLKNSRIFEDTNDAVDAFLCQISTNDCTNERLKKRGAISAFDIFDLEEFDASTTLGAIEYIIGFVKKRYGCPIYFYSGAFFGDGSDKTKRQSANPKGSEYGKLVDQVLEIAEKWNRRGGADVRVIDLYHDEAFNARIADAYYAWAMNDPIHPKKAGYLQWWMPYFEARLINDFR